MSNPTVGERRPPRRWSRRRFLVAGGAAALTTGLAGCTEQVTDYEFRADQVVLSEAVRASLDYELLDSHSVTTERSRTVSGVDVTATVESQVTVYGTGQLGDGTPARPDLGVLSTPAASVMGRSFNPLAAQSLATLLDSAAGRAFLRRAGLNDVGADGEPERIRWERGPRFLAAHDGRCLDRRVTLDSYAGVLGDGAPSVAFLHLARAEADSVVVASGVHGRDVEAPDRSFVGSEDGYLPPDRFEMAVETYGDATAALRYER